jgi:hypothetical protein
MIGQPSGRWKPSSNAFAVALPVMSSWLRELPLEQQLIR